MPAQTKASWRRQFRAYRRSLSAAAYRARSTLIAHRALAVSSLARAQVVHAYWPLTGQREVDTRLLIAALRGRGAEIVLPVVTSFAPDTPSLEHRRYEGPRCLAANTWDIQEPQKTDRVSTGALDLVVVPALGMDENGHRVGHGSGYYDAFLQSLSCPRIGLTYERCLVPSLPTASHDIPMTTIVTERRIVDV